MYVYARGPDVIRIYDPAVAPEPAGKYTTDVVFATAGKVDETVVAPVLVKVNVTPANGADTNGVITVIVFAYVSTAVTRDDAPLSAPLVIFNV